MDNDAMGQEELNTALHLENLFISQHWGPQATPTASDLWPTPAQAERAIANIRAWRKYLPDACVQTMIDEGWQWST
jgi:hypothetical protein